MRTFTTALAAVAITVLCGFGVTASRQALRALPGGTERILAVTGSKPAAWVFVRQGCPHCAAHLDALERAAAALAPARRRTMLARVHICGWLERVPAGAIPEPDSMARIAGVHLVPTTCFIRAGGAIERVWRGARSSVVWSRALRRLELGGAS